MQGLGPALRGQTRDAATGQGSVPISLGREPDLRPGSPVDAQARQAGSAAMQCEPVQESVCRRVVALPGRAEQPGSRRVQHEEVQVMFEGGPVQVPGARGFRAPHRVEPGLIQLQEHPIVERPCRVHDAGQGRHRVVHLAQQRVDLIRLGHVDRAHLDLGSGAAQLVQFARRFKAGLSSPDQHQVARALVDQVPRSVPAEVAEPAGDEVGGVRPNHKFVGGHPDPIVAVRPKDDLARVPGPGDVRERVDRRRVRELGHGQRLQLAGAESFDQPLEERGDQLRPVGKHGLEVHGEERPVLAEREQPEVAVVVDVLLADLDEPPAGREHGEAPGLRLAGQ